MRLNLIAATILGASALTACVPGESEFSCQGYPDGVSCISARNVYELTNSRSRVTQADLEQIGVGQGPAFDQVLEPLPSSDARQELAPPLTAGQSAAEPAQGVMRVWVGPHTSTNGDVTAPNYVYSHVGDGTDVDGLGHTRRFEPLKGQSEPTQALDARPLKPSDVTVTAEPAADPAGSKGERDTVLSSRHVLVAEIYFDSGKAKVSAGGQQRLKNASARIAELQPQSLVVAGFTDRVGSKEANQRLAKRRVDAVVDILKSSGVTIEIIDTAQGEIDDLAASADGTEDPNSRKVWVIAVDSAAKVAPASATASPEQSGPKSLTNAADKRAETPPQESRTVVAKTDRIKPSGSERDPRGCRLCRGSDDHGESDKDHDPGMNH